MSNRKNTENIVSPLIIIKATINDNNIYNHDYVKSCKSEYIFKHTIYECPYCLEHYPEKFKKS